ncbi:MAG: hypothetical protein C3F06_04340 [Candidatus Methanoperedenaceae archaeon]|nr:MAG: hypothetical protein C3F06_04340 [Candidatus Methanoperedenaceae archaeon]
MFENIFKGFLFIKESFSLILKDADVIKPSFYSIFVGMFFTIFSVIIMLFIESNLHLGNLFYILAFLVFLGNYLISYFFSGMTAFLVYDYFKDGDATMSEAWAAVRKNILTIFYLAIVSSIVNIITGVLRGRSRRDSGLGGGFSEMILGFIERAWTVATYFMIPAIVIEDRDLKGAVERATQIITKNLLPIGVGEIAVGLVTWIFSVIGFIIAIVIGVSLLNVTGPVLALLMAGILILIVIALSMYVTTAYHTCLFLWARSAESTGIPGSLMSPPAPIANALGQWIK